MKRLLIALVILVVILGVALVGLAIADGKLRTVAENEAERRLAKALPIDGEPTVAIEGFPFVLGVLLDERIQTLHVRMSNLEWKGVRVDAAKLTVHGLTIDRDALIDAQHLTVTGIETAQIEAWMTADDLARVAPVPVSIEDGRVEVTYKGKVYTGRALVKGHAVMVMVEGMPPLIAPLPNAELIPCEPALDIDNDRIHVACEVDELPPAVQKVLAQHL